MRSDRKQDNKATERRSARAPLGHTMHGRRPILITKI